MTSFSAIEEREIYALRQAFSAWRAKCILRYYHHNDSAWDDQINYHNDIVFSYQIYLSETKR